MPAGLGPEKSNWKVGGNVGLSPPLIVIVFALALNDKSSETAANATAVSPSLLMFSPKI